WILQFLNWPIPIFMRKRITCVTVCENWKICRFMKLDRLIRIMKSSCEMEHLKRQRPNEVLTDAPCAAKRVPIGVISRLIISSPEIRAAKAYPKICKSCAQDATAKREIADGTAFVFGIGYGRHSLQKKSGNS